MMACGVLKIGLDPNFIHRSSLNVNIRVFQESLFSGEIKNMRLLIASCKRNEMELKKKLHELEEEKHAMKLRNETLVRELDKEKNDHRRVSDDIHREAEEEKAELRRRSDDLLNEMNSLKSRQSAAADEDQRRLIRIMENQIDESRYVNKQFLLN